MTGYLLRRLALLPPTLLGVCLLTFLLFDVVGGSPAVLQLGQNASAEALAEFDRQHGYDRPLLWARRVRVPGIGDGVVTLPEGQPPGEPLRWEWPYRLLPGRYEWRLRGRGGSGPAGGSAVRSARLRLVTAAGRREDAPVLLRPRRDGVTLVFEVPDAWRGEGLELQVRGLPAEGVDGALRRRPARPHASQLAAFLGRVLRGDLGESSEYREPVLSVLRDGVWVSLALTVPILVAGTALALLLGVLCAAARGGRFDRTALALTTALMSVNYVVWVVAGQYWLAFRWRLFPLWGFESWAYLVLPVAIGVVSGLGRDVRFYRTVLLDEVRRPYVRTAIAKGLHPARVLGRHVLRNSAIPVITQISLAIPFLFTGSILLESFFGLPGLGGMGLNAVHSSDLAMLRAVVLVGAVLYQLAQLGADVLYAVCDPRARAG